MGDNSTVNIMVISGHDFYGYRLPKHHFVLRFSPYTRLAKLIKRLNVLRASRAWQMVGQHGRYCQTPYQASRSRSPKSGKIRGASEPMNSISKPGLADLIVNSCPEGCGSCLRLYINELTGHRIVCNCLCHDAKKKGGKQ
jgi:hypothetical protein